MYDGEKVGFLLGLGVKDGENEGIEEDGEKEGVLLGFAVAEGCREEVAEGLMVATKVGLAEGATEGFGEGR